VLLGTRVTGLEPGGGGRVQIATDQPHAHTADVVVNCAGPDARSVAALAGLHLQTEGPVGMNVVAASDLPLNRVVRSPSAHFRPETGGRVMIAAPAADAQLARGGDANELAPRVVAAAAEHLSGLREAVIEELRVARRAIPADGLPVVGRTIETPWLYHVVTHSGVTLAPLLGRLVADELVNHAHHERLRPYRPARLAVSVSS
jgi:glycine/D-amino acid oxidase-like deaminating enzyme